jgi:cytochrome c5
MKSMLIVAAAVSALFAQNAMAADGKGTYTKACASCHATGAANAPKFGDKAAWAPRIKTGMPALYNTALKGKPGTAMMPKGGNASLSDDDVKAAVDYMVAAAK